MSNKERYDKYIEELNGYYNKNEVKTLVGLKDALSRIKSDIEFPNKLRTKIILNLDKVLVGLFCLLIVLIGLTNAGSFGLYLAGCAFFFAGLFVGMFVPKFGIIFLFSHGATGFFFMVNCLLSKQTDLNGVSKVLDSPILRDNPGFIKTYLLLIFIAILSGIVTAILYNVLSVFKNKRYSIVIPFALFFISILMIYLLGPLFHIV